jgi:peptidoglycan/LPS O-acetylase OafA/YrhL
MHYRPEIDGLRALSVVAVILFHAHLYVPGGFVGVDVFFVISGYLIASLVARELEGGEFRIAKFWERRVRRIFPAGFLVVLSTLLVGAVVCMPGAYVLLARSAFAQSLMAANIYFWRTGQLYNTSETTPLLHMWSLGVEEQFYLIFPLVLAWLWPRGKRVAFIVLSVVMLTSLGVSIGGSSILRMWSFYLLPSRAWEMLLGALLTIRPPFLGNKSAQNRPRLLAGWAGIGAILVACTQYSTATPYPGWHALVPCAGTALFLWSQEAGPVGVGRFLACQLLRLLGQMSYSLYLWHWPVMAFFRVLGYEGRRDMASAICITLGLSILSWRFIEEPCRRRFRGFGTWQILAIGAAMSLTTMLLSAAILATGGAPGRLPQSIRLYGVVQLPKPEEHPLVPLGFRADQGLPLVGEGGLQPTRPRLVLWGDSHAEFVSPVIHRLALKNKLSVPVALRFGRFPFPGEYYADQDASEGRDVEETCLAIEKLRPYEVLVVANWTAYFNRLVRRSTAPDPSVDAVENARRIISRTFDRLRAAGVEQIWIGLEIPFQSMTPEQIAMRQFYSGVDALSVGVGREAHATRKALARSVFAKFEGEPGVHFIDLAEACFSEDGIAYAESPEGPLYSNETHLSGLGAERFLQRLLEESFFKPD